MTDVYLVYDHELFVNAVYSNEDAAKTHANAIWAGHFEKRPLEDVASDWVKELLAGREQQS